MIRLLLIAFTCLWVMQSATAGVAGHTAVEPFTIPSPFHSADLTRYIEYLPDPDGDLTPRSALARTGWHPLRNSDIGYFRYPVWTRVALKNPSKTPLSLVLHNPRAGVNRIDVFQMQGSRVIGHSVLGLLPPRDEQPEWGRFPSLSVTVPASGGVTLVTRIASTSPIDASWIAHTQSGYSIWTSSDSWIRGVFAGVLLTMMIYSVWLWRSLRQPILIAYAAFGVLLFLFTFTYQGFYHLYDFGLPSIYGYFITWLTGGLLAISMVAIAMYLFETGMRLPKIHATLRWLVVVLMGIVAAVLVGILTDNLARVTPLVHGGVIITSIALLGTAMIAWHRRFPGAGYYLAGQGSMLVVIVLINVAQLGWQVDASELALAIPAATLIDVILLAKAISERLARMNQELEAQRAHAITQSRFAALGKTIGLITHQWRAPLARQGALLTELAVSLRQPEPSELAAQLDREWLPRMQQNLTLLDQTVRDFRAYFTAEQPTACFELVAVINQTCSLVMWQQTLPHLQIDWTPPSTPLHVMGEQKALAHVLLIVLDNALETFVAREVTHPVIRVRCGVEGTQVTIHIDDNAGGIVIQPVDRIFDEFVTTGRVNGSGMGLFFARMLVEDRLNGTISAHNVGPGACLSITLNRQTES